MAISNVLMRKSARTQKTNGQNLISIGIFLSDFGKIGDFFQKCEKFLPWAKIFIPTLILIRFCLFVFALTFKGG